MSGRLRSCGDRLSHCRGYPAWRHSDSPGSGFPVRRTISTMLGSCSRRLLDHRTTTGKPKSLSACCFGASSTDGIARSTSNTPPSPPGRNGSGKPTASPSPRRHTPATGAFAQGCAFGNREILFWMALDAMTPRRHDVMNRHRGNASSCRGIARRFWPLSAVPRILPIAPVVTGSPRRATRCYV